MRVNITLLSYDHGILRQVFDVLDDVARTGTFDKYRDIMPEVSEFLLKYMDGYHHGKEERFIFPQADRAADRVKAMIPELVDDHRKAKAFALAIKQNIDTWDVGPLAQNVMDLVAHMRSHITEEEDFVFPALEEAIDADRDLELFDEAQKFVREGFGEDYPQRMEKFANELQERVWGQGVIKAPAMK